MSTTTDWIEHDGKGRPVDANTRVEVRLRDGTKQLGSAGYWDSEDPCESNWVFDPASPAWDIVAYRVVSKTSVTESPTRALRNPLTKRQTSIVAALAAGEWRKNIASDHGVSQVTIHTWIAQAKTAARANTAEHLIAMAVKEGWIE